MITLSVLNSAMSSTRCLQQIYHLNQQKIFVFLNAPYHILRRPDCAPALARKVTWAKMSCFLKGNRNRRFRYVSIHTVLV